MPVGSNLDDTANLNCDLGFAPHHSLIDLDHTDRFRILAPAPFAAFTGGSAHSYAEGIIRFYRARQILRSGCPAENMRRAWRYLAPLSPHEMPVATRRRFLELVYCMQQSDSIVLRPTQFAHMVRAIAVQIDGYVDRLNARLENAC